MLTERRLIKQETCSSTMAEGQGCGEWSYAPVDWNWFGLNEKVLTFGFDIVSENCLFLNFPWPWFYQDPCRLMTESPQSYHHLQHSTENMYNLTSLSYG